MLEYETKIDIDAPAEIVWEVLSDLAAHGERTHFEMCEVFSGPMLELIARSIPDMTEAFDAFAAGLEARAEQRVREAVPTRAAS